MTKDVIGQVASISVAGWLAASLGLLGGELAEAPLHVRIDRAIEAGTVAPVAGPASDEEIVRRLYLDLRGRIPSAAEARAYLSDQDPGKNGKLIDQLLRGRESARHLATSFDTWLMERRSEGHVPAADWRNYLTESFAANKPFDQLAREILAADGTAETGGRARARFYLDRIGEPHLLTRDVGRLFFGKDLQCAQCHDHPNVDDFLQRDYYGLFAFYTRTSLFHPDTKKPSLLTEKASGEAAFQSVFTDVKGLALPRPPNGEEIPDPEVKPGDEYKVKPNPKDKNVRAVPRYSRRVRLAEAATDGTNRSFNRNIVNRLWAHMMGRGLVDPPDMMHAENPASHPELLDLLADEFVAMNFDVRAFLSELALTQTYARTFEMPVTLGEDAEAVKVGLAELEAESKGCEAAAREAKSAFSNAKDLWEDARKEFDKHSGQLAEATKKREETEAAAKKAEEPLKKARESFAVAEARLGPLAEAEKETAEAVAALPDDPELAQAATVFRKRSEAARAEVAKLREDVTAKEKSFAEADAQRAAARTAERQAQEVVDRERTKLTELVARLDGEHRRYRKAESQAEHAERRLEDAQALIAYAETDAAASAAEAETSELGSQLGRLESEFARSEELATNLAEALHHAEAAREKLSNDSGLAEAVNILRERSARAGEQAAAGRAAVEALRTHTDAAKNNANEWRDKLDTQLADLTERWSASFTVGAFAPLSPEQLCTSTLQATGEWKQVRAAVEAEFEKRLAEAAEAESEEGAKKEAKAEQSDKKPAPPELTEADRQHYIEEQMAARLKGAYDKFARLFGGQAGQPQSEFYATADQALFFENDGLVRGWLRPKDENLGARLAKLEDPGSLAEELYLSTLTRYPSEEETKKMHNYLAAREEERAQAIQELAWALISSLEFRFKH